MCAPPPGNFCAVPRLKLQFRSCIGPGCGCRGGAAVAAPNWQNGLPAPLARDRGAPRPQHGHPDSRLALVTRLDQVGLRCWLDTSPPRRRDAPHAHDAGAERARGVRVGLNTSYSAPSCLLPLGLFTRGQCSAVSGRAAHYHALEQPAEPQHTPYVRAERARGDHTAPTLHPRTRGVHTERLRSHTSDPCIPARPPHGAQWSHARHPHAPRHDDAREVHAGRSWGGRTVRCDRPWSQGHRLGVVFASPRTLP